MKSGITRLDHFVTPELGVLLANIGGTTPDRLLCARQTLHSRYYRNAIRMDQWVIGAGDNTIYDDTEDAGMLNHTVLDTFSQGGGRDQWYTLTADLTAYAARVEDVLIQYPGIRIIIIDNEELNDNENYHAGTPAQYINQCSYLVPICKKHNVLMANGGIGDNYAIDSYVFRWIKANYNQATADAFAAVSNLEPLTSEAYRQANGDITHRTDLEAKTQNMVLVAESNIWNVFNIHKYEPTGTQTGAVNTTAAHDIVWRYYMECFSTCCPGRRRLVMCNETGTRESYHGELVQSMQLLAIRYGYLWYDHWSGDGAALNAVPLTDGSCGIYANGTAYRDKQDAFYSGDPLQLS